jgi:hypothetical protein
MLDFFEYRTHVNKEPPKELVEELAKYYKANPKELITFYDKFFKLMSQLSNEVNIDERSGLNDFLIQLVNINPNPQLCFIKNFSYFSNNPDVNAMYPKFFSPSLMDYIQALTSANSNDEIPSQLEKLNVEDKHLAFILLLEQSHKKFESLATQFDNETPQNTANSEIADKIQNCLDTSNETSLNIHGLSAINDAMERNKQTLKQEPHFQTFWKIINACLKIFGIELKPKSLQAVDKFKQNLEKLKGDTTEEAAIEPRGPR